MVEHAFNSYIQEADQEDNICEFEIILVWIVPGQTVRAK